MITLTENAIKRIHEVGLKKNLKKCYFRITIEGGGCQGFSYSFSFEDKKITSDNVFDYNQVSVLIDQPSLDIIDGSKIDFVTDLMGSYFKIENPQASSTCGCGTSFAV